MTVQTADIRTWCALLPKVELHVHLEGAIPHKALWELVGKYGGDPEAPNPEALGRKFVFRDFDHFVAAWMWKNRFLREYEDFTIIAEAFAHDMLRQNIRYAEVFYSPPDFARHGLQTGKLTEAIRQGFAAVPEARIALVADLVRDYGPEQAMRTLAEVREAREYGVIGIGIGGMEHKHPPEPFAPVFAEARRLGFHTSAHAGEAAGAASIWDAVRLLKADRIGHAARAAEDPALMEYLAANQIALELCPLSNVRTGVFAALEEHPVRRYYDMGMALSINTDDPSMFNNSLAEEYALLCENMGFSRAEIVQLIESAVLTSWLGPVEKENLLNEFRTHPAWNSDTDSAA